MNKFIQNITQIHGNQGKKWLDNLPTLIDSLARQWGLYDIVPVDNMTFNYVAKAITQSEQSVVIKIGYDEKSIHNEIQALKYFNGIGSINLIKHNKEFHAMLLQQANPGNSLKSIYPKQSEYVMDAYIETMKKLHSKELLNQHEYHHISEWLNSIDNLTPKQLPKDLLNQTINLKNQLLSSMGTLVYLHGDLHHDNILKNNDEWLAIDPKGIIGEAEFEIAAFDFMYVSELANSINAKELFKERIKLLAHKAQLSHQRIKDWVFIRLILMAAWTIEDNGNPNHAIKLAELLIS